MQLEVNSAKTVMAGPNASNFGLVSAYKTTKTLWNDSNFAAAKNREDLVSKLDSAISASGKQIRLDL